MKLRIATDQPRQVVDLTVQVQAEVERAKLKNGLTALTVLHTTCGLTTADLDPGTDQDFLDFLQSLVPDPPAGGWRHSHDPAHTPSHLLSSLIGTSITLAVEDDKLQLGLGSE